MLRFYAPARHPAIWIRSALLPVVSCVLVLAASCSKDSVSPTEPDHSLSGQLASLTGASRIPGAAGIVFSHDTVADLQASGVRRAGDTAKLTIQDYLHVGSLTKWMTATMIGTLVDDGLLSWSSRPADVIPGISGSIDSGYANITLLDLLQHRAGIPADDDFDSLPTLTGTLRQRRLQAAQLVLGQPPAVTPGTFRYANVGYVIAACMAETVADQDWRTVMDTRLFQPLGISAFYGWPTEHDANQPWGHVLNGRNFEAVAPSVESSDLDFLEPAGFVSMTLEDYRVFIQLQMDAARGNPRLLSAGTFQTLNTPNGDYACGVQVATIIPHGTLYWHNGSNTFFYMVMYMIPEKDVSVVIGVNAGDESVYTAVGQAAETVLKPLID